MKKLVEVREDGIESLMGEQVILLCLNYFYAGKLVGVNRTCVLLHEAKIVYETGEWGASAWKDAQAIGQPLYVQRSKIEAFCKGK